MTDLGAQLFVWALTAWVQGLILFAAVWIAERLGLLGSPGLRQAAWRAVLILPLFSAAFQVFATGGPMTGATLLTPSPSALAAAAASTQAPASLAAAATPSPQTVLAEAFVWLRPFLGWAWLAWLAISVLRIARQRWALSAYRRRLAPVADAETLALGRELARAARVRGLNLLIDPDLAGPIAIAPATVVLPSWAALDLTGLQRRALLAHEVSHLSRRDPQWRALTALAASVLLAPYGRLARRRLEAVAEHACDAWSAGRTDGGAALAQCLAACLERGLAGRAPRWASAMAESEAGVVERARRLVEGRTVELRQRVWGERAGFVGMLALTSTFLPGFAIAHLPVDTGPVAAPAAAAAITRPAAVSIMRVATAPARHVRLRPSIVTAGAAEPGPAVMTVAAARAAPSPAVLPPVASAPASRPVAAVRPLAAVAPTPALPALPASPAAPIPPSPVAAPVAPAPLVPPVPPTSED